MNFKDKMQSIFNKLKSVWKTGKVQRSSRITYGVIWNIILFFLVVGFIGLFFVGGVGAGYFASLLKDEQIRDYETMAQDIYDYAETSRTYFANNVYLGDVRADLHRDETTLDEIAPLLIDAVIATEDEYFNEHQGIVPKAIFRAVVQEVTNSANQTGGSTLTQQLIKNQILTNEVSFERKAKEILLALRLERFFEKDEILEAYLNIVPYGRNASGQIIAGVQTAAQGIFGVDASEVNLAQAAYLAGLPQSPSAYTPFASGGGLKSEEGMQSGLNRMKTVLNRMLEMEYITNDQYNKALNYDLVADFKEKEESPLQQYPILIDEIEARAKEILFDYFIEKDGYNEQDLKAIPELREEYELRASRALSMNGYEIHSTIDKEIYDAFKKVAAEFNDYGPNTWTKIPVADGSKVEREQYVQAAGVMIENSTGRIISFLGSREFSLEDQLNYTTRPRSNGSTMKPFVYASAFEEGLLQPGTPIPDVFLEVPSGGGTHVIQNIDLRYHGMLSTRTHLTKSYNVPAVRAYLPLINVNIVDKYLRNMGMTTIDDDEYGHPTLAIGGTRRGPSVEENANGFSTLANYGQFNDAYIIEKITTKDGEVIYQHESEPVQVYSPQTSYLVLDIMRDVLSDGTATSLKPMLKYSGVDWAGKTGTSQSIYDVHFAASNPNITFATWMGYEFNDSLPSLVQSPRNLKLWAALINAASDINPELVAPSHAFQQPEGIVSRSYCAISGMLPSDLCEKAGLIKSDLFNAKYVPTERDNSLISGEHVLVNGKSVPVGPKTPSEFTNGNGLMFNPEFLKAQGIDKLSDMTQIIPTTADRSKWEQIGFPGSSVTSGIDDDGKPPAPPTSIKANSKKLSWNASNSKDVVGYRIYQANEPDGKFSRIGSTTSEEFTTNADFGVYHVTAVDYFGMESNESSTVIIGDPPKVEEEKPEKDDSDDKKKDKEEKEDKNGKNENSDNKGKNGNNGKGNDNKDNEDD